MRKNFGLLESKSGDCRTIPSTLRTCSRTRELQILTPKIIQQLCNLDLMFSGEMGRRELFALSKSGLDDLLGLILPSLHTLNRVVLSWAGLVRVVIARN